jgi:prolyl-tRNA editing enzyme YbaK/EbsC (Cys-tRNA(Pro) deacylase)
MKNNNDLKKFLEKSKIDAEIIKAPSTKTAQKASEALGVNNVVKSIVFAASGKGILAIVRGEDRVDFQKLKKAAKKTCNTASPEQVFKFTSYPAGGVPPLSTGLETYIDKSVVKLEEVYAGAGTPNHLIRIKAKDIVKYSKGKVVDISK